MVEIIIENFPTTSFLIYNNNNNKKKNSRWSNRNEGTSKSAFSFLIEIDFFFKKRNLIKKRNISILQFFFGFKDFKKVMIG